MKKRKVAKKKAAKKNNGRAEGQTQISISMPVDLVKAIDAKAKSECRNRSNYIVRQLIGSLT